MSPAVVAFVRGLALAVTSAVVTFLIANLSGLIPESYAVYVPVAILALRQLEGLLDQYRKPNQNTGGRAGRGPGEV
jgi:Na+-transporting NADH:ubiquinone oxidoreductase subunit NqrD